MPVAKQRENPFFFCAWVNSEGIWLRNADSSHLEITCAHFRLNANSVLKSVKLNIIKFLCEDWGWNSVVERLPSMCKALGLFTFQYAFVSARARMHACVCACVREFVCVCVCTYQINSPQLNFHLRELCVSNISLCFLSRANTEWPLSCQRHHFIWSYAACCLMELKSSKDQVIMPVLARLALWTSLTSSTPLQCHAQKRNEDILNRFHTSISVSHRRNGMKCPLWHFEWCTVARKCPESFVSTWNLRMWPYLEAESLPRQGLKPCSNRIVRIDPKANDSVLARKRKWLQRCSVRGHTEQRLDFCWHTRSKQ